MTGTHVLTTQMHSHKVFIFYSLMNLHENLGVYGLDTY